MKTIFVDLFSIVSLPNLTLHGGVIELLSKRKDIKVVLLIPSDPAFHAMMKPFVDNGAVIEEVRKCTPQSPIEKLFLFFYSYLLFTSTTKMLATFGARADSPPAGGNRHVWFIKAFIANTFGRIHFVKLKFVPWLYTKIFKTRPYKALFNRHNPGLVFTPNIAFQPGIELVAEAKRRAIPTVGMPTNWDHLNKYYIPIHADYLLVQNEPMLEEAVNYHLYDPKTIQVVGFPQFDVYVHDEFFLSRQEFFNQFGIPEDRKIILFISGSVYAQDEPEILEHIANTMKENKFGMPVALMIRPYVGMRNRSQEEKKYEQLLEDKNIVFNWKRNDNTMENRVLYNSMMRYADVVISVYSTTAIEAAIFDHQAIAIGFDGSHKRPWHKSVRRLETLSHFSHVLETQAVPIARSFEDLEEKLRRYLDKPELDTDKRRVLVDKMCYKVDGRSSERIVEFLMHHIL